MGGRGAKFLDELRWRGLLYQQTAGEELQRHLQTKPRVAYCGFDPTADSLHIGHLLPLKLLAHWQRCGHTPVVVIGGGTGLIGDPSGLDSERLLLGRDMVEANVASQRQILCRVLDFDTSLANTAVIRNNIEWLEGLKFIDVLRDVGKHFSVNAMIQKDSVKRRLQEREQGISYTEFSYMILQAYDFLHLRRTADCTVQMAGSDQYGNIVAGIDLIRRACGSSGAPESGEAYGITAPLVARSDGAKMSKSSGTAIWLSADTRNRTSPYAFYQHWINLPDDDVVQWLKWYTFISREEIEDLGRRHEIRPQERIGQRALASHMTALLHGDDQLTRVQNASEALFGSGDLRGLDELTLSEVVADVPHSTHHKSLLDCGGVSVVELLVQTSLASSRRAAREHVRSGAVSVNGRRLKADCNLTTTDLLHGRTILLKRGKKHYYATDWI